MFKHLVWISAVIVALCAALFSVTGIATLFSAKFLAVAVMASALEIGKLVMASYLYRWWRKTPILLKTYAVTAVGILMVVTSIGIYGYLTAAYATVAAVPQNTLNEIGFVETRQTSLDESILRLRTDNTTINSRQAQAQAALDNVLTGATDLSQRSAFANLRQEIAGLDVERQGNNARIESAISERDSLENVQVTLNSELNTNSDIGPFIYIARTLNMPLDTVVKWFVLVLIFVFDPLAISLILAYNNIVVKEMEARGEEIDETVGFNPFSKTTKTGNSEIVVSPSVVMEENTPDWIEEAKSITAPPEEPVEEVPEEPVEEVPEEPVEEVPEEPVVQSVARLIPRELAPPEPMPELEVVEEEPHSDTLPPGVESEDFVKAVSDSIIETMEATDEEESTEEEVSTDIYDDPTSPAAKPPEQGPINTTNEFSG